MEEDKTGSRTKQVLVAVLILALFSTFLVNCTGGKASSSVEYTDDSPTVSITVNGIETTMKLADNETTAALLERAPLTMTMTDLNSNEKIGYFDGSLPTDDAIPDSISRGDVFLFGNNSISIFYKDFRTSYSYTPIGHIDDESVLESISGTQSAEVTIG